jgi:hypothetical protein
LEVDTGKGGATGGEIPPGLDFVDKLFNLERKLSTPEPLTTHEKTVFKGCNNNLTAV